MNRLAIGLALASISGLFEEGPEQYELRAQPAEPLPLPQRKTRIERTPYDPNHPKAVAARERQARKAARQAKGMR